MVCKKCGNEVGEGAKFCRYCGAPLAASEKPVAEAPLAPSAVPEEAVAAEASPKQSAPVEISAVAPVAEASAASKGKKKSKKLIVIIVIVFLVVAAAAAGIGIYLFTSSPQYKYDKALEKAKQHFEDEEYDDAISCYNEALVWMEDSREVQKGILKTYLKLAEKRYAEGRYEESIEYYDLVLQESKNENAQTGRTQSYLALGKQKFESGEYKAAYDAYQKVLEADEYHTEVLSQLPDLHLALGRECFEAGQYDDAFNYYEAVRMQAPDREEIYRGESDIYLQRGDVKQAITLLDEGILMTSAAQLSDRKQYIIDNSVVSSVDEYYYGGNYSYHREYDTEGNVTKEQSFYGCDEQSRTLNGEWECDNEGNIIKSAYYNRQGNMTYKKDESAEASYFSNGTIQYQITRDEAIHYDENGNLLITEKCTRNSAGEVTHVEGIGPAGDVYYTADYTYGTGGNLEKIKGEMCENLSNWVGGDYIYYPYPTDWFWEVASWYGNYEQTAQVSAVEQIFDENNHVVSWWVTAADGTGYGDEYSYDEKGNRVQEWNYYSDGTKNESRYTYDAYGNQTESISIDNEGRTRYYEQSSYITEDLLEWNVWYSYDEYGDIYYSSESNYYYNDNNDLLQTTTLTNSPYSGTSYSERLYTYDNKGNCTSELCYNDEEGYYWKSETTYDDRGNCISQICYSYGERYSETQYTYDSDGRNTGMVVNGNYNSYREEYRYDEFGQIIESYRDSELNSSRNCEYMFVG